MPIFLHGHLEHLVGNLVGQVFMGAGIEYGIGLGPFIFLYMITGIGGNLLSACIMPASYSVGASTAVFGLVGYLIAYVFTNWQQMG
jgi:rhomboid protease GluP